MKSYLIKYLIFFIYFLITLDTSSLAGNVRKVNAIEFRGLKYLSKNEIINKVRIKAVKDGIIIDVDSVKTVLSNTGIIEKFNITGTGNKLIITVTEKVPLMCLALKEGKRVIPFELDKEFRIVAKNRIHAIDKPFIIIGKKDITGGDISENVKSLYLLLKYLKENRLSIYKEISEIYLADSGIIRVILYGRGTNFILKPDYNSFIKLECIAGYLDRKRYYPDILRLLDNTAVIR